MESKAVVENFRSKSLALELIRTLRRTVGANLWHPEPSRVSLPSLFGSQLIRRRNLARKRRNRNLVGAIYPVRWEEANLGDVVRGGWNSDLQSEDAIRVSL